MTTIQLTPEQEQAVAAKLTAEYKRDLTSALSGAARSYKALQRKTDDQVNRARQATKEWKQRYTATREELLKARAEIVQLKRRLQDGDWS